VGTIPNERPWPRERFVAVVSADAQEGLFLDIELVSRLPEGSVLRAAGPERWMPGERVREALADLIGLASDDHERLSVTQATQLVDYAITTGTGVAVVPPTCDRSAG
jgi:hypothetical protein